MRLCDIAERAQNSGSSPTPPPRFSMTFGANGAQRRHGEPPWRCRWIAKLSNSAGRELLAPGITMPSGSSRLHAEAPQIVHHRANPVRLLDAKFARIAHPQPSSVAATEHASTGISSISAAVSAPSTVRPSDQNAAPRCRRSTRRLQLSSVGMRILAPMPPGNRAGRARGISDAANGELRSGNQQRGHD